MKKIISKNRLMELCDIIKTNNICIIEIPRGEEREMGAENLFDKIRAKNFLNLGKEQLSISRKYREPQTR